MKAQISLEVLTYLIIMVVILGVVIYVALDKTSAIHDEKINTNARSVLKLVAIEINTAVSIGSGYENTFRIPEYLYGRTDYTITLDPDYQRIYISWSDGFDIVPILTSNITGAVNKGLNSIKNEDGLIKFE